jgi:hypothetical protein
MTADATGDTDGASRPRDEAQADLWERYDRFGVGDDVVGEGRQFDTTTHCRAMDVDRGSRSQAIQPTRRAPSKPSDVSGRYVRSQPELTEITPATKRRPIASQHHGRNGTVCFGERERIVEFISQLGGDRVVASRSIQRDDQRATISGRGHNGASGTGRSGRGLTGTPCRELGPCLQEAVGG